MQAQATGSRRYGFNGMAMLALAIGLLAVAAAAVAVSTFDFGADPQASTLRAHPAPLQGEGHIDPANAVVANPQTAPIVHPAPRFAGEGRLEMRFLEQNVQLPDGVLIEPAQSVEQMRFLEQNIWDYAPAPAAYQGLDTYQPQAEGLDYKFLEENLWNVGPAATSPEAVGIHRDEGFDNGLDY